jgi:diguanylate cyclase (GGDEF)-like protein/PAS domain S-box-containing protein
LLKEQLRAVLDATSEALVAIDTQERVILFNAAAERMFGYSASEVIGSSAECLMPARHRRSFRRDLARYLRTGEARAVGAEREVEAVRKDGSVFPALMRVTAVRPAAGKLFVASVRDITDRVDAAGRIERLSNYDVLTGLPNRRLFQEHLERAVASAGIRQASMALLYLDLDRFKSINDTFGHTTGDRLLVAVAERVAQVVRVRDCIGRPTEESLTAPISRLGGDEFTVLLTDLRDRKGAAVAARRILAALSQSFSCGADEVFATASIGIAMYPDDGSDALTLMRCADTAVTRAKQQGTARYCFYAEEMNTEVARGQAIEFGMRRALERGEFQLEFQPMIDSEHGRLRGAEALLRWRSRELGPVSAAEFIPVAERTGMIDAIGDWVLKETCKQASEWRRDGLPPIRIAVNVSPNQLKRRGFADGVARTLARNGLPSDAIELEITETVIMADDQPVCDSILELHQLGIRLALDDFGTGYSSLHHLARFPLDRIKIDRTFVAQIASSAQGEALVSAMIDLAHRLGLRVVAEGVEQRAQLEFLLEQGCDEVQGFLFSRPVPARRFADLLVMEQGAEPWIESKLKNSD